MKEPQRNQRDRNESKRSYDERQLRNIRMHLESLLTDEERQRFGISFEEHEPHFQVFRALCALNDTRAT